MAEYQGCRLLLAAVVQPDIAAEMHAWGDRLDIYGKRLDSDRLHMTLLMLGDFPFLSHALVALVRDAIAAAPLAAFRVVLDRLLAGDRSTLLVPSQRLRGAERFCGQLVMALAARGVQPASGWRFQPHITLAHGDGRGLDQPIDPISWKVDEIALIQSHVGATVHGVLDRWQLPG